MRYHNRFFSFISLRVVLRSLNDRRSHAGLTHDPAEPPTKCHCTRSPCPVAPTYCYDDVKRSTLQCTDSYCSSLNVYKLHVQRENVRVSQTIMHRSHVTGTGSVHLLR
ncbi:hypothetical protein EVAR_88080_1 [Eumeta japonica]|uniref:Uncharacterized protein n=1 Tax=Eumeta variegata TaxID=151549 RepID=A0A4C1WJF6_EUMVA|nr:hypothetical protein EVAR_88080_1 [Eumeta japonica]